MRDRDKEKADSIIVNSFQKVRPESYSDVGDLFAWWFARVIGKGYSEYFETIDLSSAEIDTPAYYLFLSDLSRNQGNHELVEVYADSARTFLEKGLRLTPQHPQLHSKLGLAYARLHRKEDAIREGELGTNLLPTSKDIYAGASLVVSLAYIYADVGSYDLALEQLERLIGNPGLFKVNILRLDRTWDPLRDNPRFQALLEGK